MLFLLFLCSHLWKVSETHFVSIDSNNYYYLEQANTYCKEIFELSNFCTECPMFADDIFYYDLSDFAATVFWYVAMIPST